MVGDGPFACAREGLRVISDRVEDGDDADESGAAQGIGGAFEFDKQVARCVRRPRRLARRSVPSRRRARRRARQPPNPNRPPASARPSARHRCAPSALRSPRRLRPFPRLRSSLEIPPDSARVTLDRQAGAHTPAPCRGCVWLSINRGVNKSSTIRPSV